MHISRGYIYVLLIYHFFVNVDGCVRSPTWIQLFLTLLAKNMQLNCWLVFCTRCFEFNHDTTLKLLASRKNVPHQYDNVLSFIKIWHLVVMQTNWFSNIWRYGINLNHTKYNAKHIIREIQNTYWAMWTLERFIEWEIDIC